jgi:hypothetical protein
MSEEERQTKLANFTHSRQQGEKAYGEMYEAHSFSQANVCYSDAKEFFYEAIRLAEELGLAQELDSLRKRLEHIKGGLEANVRGKRG